MTSRFQRLGGLLGGALRNVVQIGAEASISTCQGSVAQPSLPGLVRSSAFGVATSRSALPCQQQLWHQAQLYRGLAQKSQAGFGRAAPVTLQSLLVALILGAVGIGAVRNYKDEKLQQVMQQSQQVVGKASVGGPFDLIDQDGKRFTDMHLRGEFALLYFGFTHCPDICPDELEKVAAAVDGVKEQTGVPVQLVFISVDPERDTPERVKAYVKEFHPNMIGLTGDLENVKKTSKAYRVYYNKTGESGTDYLVDHSIIHYLIDPEGEFVTFYGKNYTAPQMSESIAEHVTSWRSSHPDYHKGMVPPKPKQPAAASCAAPGGTPAATVKQ